MSLFFIVVLFALVLFLFYRTSYLTQENAKILKRIQSLEKRAVEAKHSAKTTEEKPVTANSKSAGDLKPTIKAEQPKPTPVALPTTTPPPAEKVEVKLEQPRPAIEPQKRNVPENTFWTTIEKQLIENWTGILGSVIMVMGVGFLGIYAALKMSAVFRFLMISGFAGALFGTFLFLRNKERWIRFGLWMRSSAAAIFLFACLASGEIEGLKWIDNPNGALALLLFGIASNLVLSWMGGKQVFASIHVLLSVVALLLLPQSIATLIIAATISLVGILLTYREKWDYHLLLTISTFFAFHLFWFTETDPEGSDNIIGIITVLCISITAAFVHYRGVYASKTFDLLPFAVHLVNWLYFGLGLIMHSTGSQLKTFIIAAGALAAFFLARYARKLGIRWLYQTDTLTAQVMMLIAIITLNDWEVGKSTIAVLGLLEVLLFSLIMAFEHEAKLYRIGSMLANAFGALIFLFSIIELNNSEIGNSNYEQAFYLSISLAAMLAFHVYGALQRWSDFSLVDSMTGIHNTEEGGKTSLLSIQVGFYILLIQAHLWEEPWIDFAIGGAIAAIFYLRQRTQSLGLLFSNWLTVLVFHFFGWFQAFDSLESWSVEGILSLLPLFGTAYLTLQWPKLGTGRLLWPGIYLVSFDLFLTVFYLFEPESTFILPVFALAAMVGYFLLARWLEGKSEEKTPASKSLIQLGFLSLGLFLLRHAFLLWDEPIEFLLFNSHQWMASIGLLAIVSIAAMKAPMLETRDDLWKSLHPLQVELGLLLFVLTIVLEVTDLAQPIVWAVSAFSMLLLGGRFETSHSRLKFYAVTAFWMTAIHSAYFTFVYVDLDSKWLGNDWISGLTSILLLFGFLGVFYQKFDLNNIKFPQALKPVEGLVETVKQNQNAALLYPLTACVTIFLYWSFDKSVLTLLWVVQSLAVFILSLVTKQQQFRYVALTGLCFCVLRLIFYDLAQAGTLTKALVFLGVGVIMLAMNWLYTKYKGRFQEEEQSEPAPGINQENTPP